MRNLFGILKKRLYEFFDRSNKKNPLGRWTIEDCQKKVNYKVDMSNEDHCGPCGLYKSKVNKKT